jgi:uroporphyrinogen-III decarboxylase
MTSRERILTALRREAPDRVPYFELHVDEAIAQVLLGRPAPPTQAARLEVNPRGVEEEKALARVMSKDNICCVLRPPVFAEMRPGRDGRLFYGEGQIRTRADLARLQLPDPGSEAVYRELASFAAAKENFALCLVTRLGFFSTVLSMGMEHLALCLYDDRALVEEVLERYCAWTEAMAERACGMGIDVFVSTDDLAWKCGPIFSPRVFRELVLPRFRRIARKISVPWILHTDGNILPLMEDLLSLGISGLHPIEPEALDIRAVKRAYGDRVCLIGNVSLNLLGAGEPEAVKREARALIRDLGPGGYILSSANSIAGYCRLENVRALCSVALEQSN